MSDDSAKGAARGTGEPWLVRARPSVQPVPDRWALPAGPDYWPVPADRSA